MKRALAAVLVLALSFCVLIGPKGLTIECEAYSLLSESEFTSRMEEVRAKYPNGGTYSGTYYENGVAKAWTCFGYACQMLYEFFGVRLYADGLRNKKDYNVGTIYAGDFVRLDAGYGPDTHSVFVTKVTADRIYFTDANYKNKNDIRWDVYYTKAEFERRFTYKIHVPGNTLLGTGETSVASKVEIQSGNYYFKNNGAGAYLCVENGVDQKNQNVLLESFSQAAAWKLSGTSSSYAIQPTCSSTRMLNSYGNTVSAGCNVCIWDDTGDASQRWKFEKTDKGYVIHNAQNWNCVLDATASGNVLVDSRVDSAAGQYWSIQNVVQYNANGGTGAPSMQFKEYDEGLKLSSTKPTRSGYVFAGWSTSASATTAQYQAGGTYSDNKNVTLYAVWKKASTLKITQQPKTAYAKMGSTVTTSVKATGDGLKYTWYVCDDGDAIYYKSSINTATYAIKMTALKSNRKVYCVVTDKYGNKVRSTTVRLRAKAAITTQPKTAYAKMGSTVKTSVKATGDGLKYTWYVCDDGDAIYYKSSINTATYAIKMTTLKSNRKVYCVVTDKYGNKVRSTTVRLRAKAAITTQPKNTYAKMGATAKVSVKATGDGLKYVWYVKNAGSSKYTKSSVTKSTYSVKMSSKTNGRKLICYVYDKYGNKVQSNTVVIKKK